MPVHSMSCKTNPEELGRGLKKEGGDASPYVLPTSQKLSQWNPSWLRDAGTTRKDPESNRAR